MRYNLRERAVLGATPPEGQPESGHVHFNYGSLFQKRAKHTNHYRFHQEEPVPVKKMAHASPSSSSSSAFSTSGSGSGSLGGNVSPLFLVGLATCSLLLIVMAAYAYSLRRRRRSTYSATSTHFLNLDHRFLLLQKQTPYEKSYLVQNSLYNAAAPPGNPMRKTTPAVRSPSSNNVNPIGFKSKSPSPTSGSQKDFSPSSSATSPKEANQSIVKFTTPLTKETKEPPCEAISAPETLSATVQPPKEASMLGKLHFKLKYSYEKRALCLTINRCTDLALPKSSVSGVSAIDPFVKMQLLPEKQHKAKTRVLRKTANPVYNEEFTFFDISPQMLDTGVVHLLVLNFDRFSKDEIIGEVVCKLNQFEFDSLGKQISVVRDVMPRGNKTKVQELGEVLVSLCYQPIANRLTVVILKARNLPRMDLTGLCDPYVKVYVFHKENRLFKKRTHVKKRTLNPVFNESFAFDIPPEEGLDNIRVQLHVFDHDRVTRNELIGKIDIGMDTGNAESDKQWHEVIKSPRRQIAEWHKLKPN